MALDLSIIGKTSDPVSFTYDKDQVILYALGIGAGLNELDYIYEKNLKVIPTFAVVGFLPIFMGQFVPDLKINLLALLHGAHEIVMHKPVPTKGIFHTTTRCDSIYDKGDKGALVNVCFETRDDNGDLLFENRVLVVDRSAGNFGGDRGPKTVRISPPEDKTPDFEVSQTIPVEQCALYRLSGDKNPLHIDPAFAQKAGFDRPILHGLCSMGYSCRAILQKICNGNPEKLKMFSVRFINVVYPGDTLITQGWKTADNHYIIQTVNQDGKIILGNATVTIQ